MIYKASMRILSLTAVAVLSCIVSAMAAEIDLHDAMNMPDHRAAYIEMLKGERGLPPWMSTPEALVHGTMADSSKVKEIDDIPQEVFYGCRQHDCGTSAIVLLFDERVKAKGVLLVGENARFFGKPNHAEKQALMAEDRR